MDFLSVFNKKRPALIASLPGNDIELARIALEAGADVIKVHMNVQHRASGLHFGTFEQEKETLFKIREIAGNRPLGIVAGNNVEDVERDYIKAVNIGFDFVSLYAKATPLSVLAYPQMKKMIALAPGYTLEDVKQLSKVGADVLEASVMHPETYGQRLTCAELMEYARICGASALPVVVPTQRAILPEEVKQLSNVGVSGLMIGAVVTGREYDGFARSVSAYRNAIDNL